MEVYAILIFVRIAKKLEKMDFVGKNELFSKNGFFILKSIYPAFIQINYS